MALAASEGAALLTVRSRTFELQNGENNVLLFKSSVYVIVASVKNLVHFT